MVEGGGAFGNRDDGEGDDVCELELRYESALRALRAEAGLDPEASRRRARELKELSREVRRAKELLASRGARPAWSHYPQQVELPRCSDDPRFVRSFAADEPDAAREFFHHFGFVVFHGVLSDAECRATVDEIWAYLEQRIEGLCRDDSETWGLLSSHKYGLPPAQAIFTKQIVANRQNPRVYASLDAVLPRLPEDGARAGPHPSPNSVVVSNDRWCVYPPALGDPHRATPASLHLDVNPWSYVSQEHTDLEALRYEASGEQVRTGDEALPLPDFRAEISAAQGAGAGQHVQGVLNLVDNDEADGGTCLVPGFHRCFPDWLDSLGALEENLSQAGPCWVQPREGGGGTFKFSGRDPLWLLQRRVPVRAGSLVLWDTLLAHGSRPNASANFRIAQFVRGFRAGQMSPSRAEARAESTRMHLQASGVLPSLGPLAPHVFGVTAPAAPGA